MDRCIVGSVVQIGRAGVEQAGAGSWEGPGRVLGGEGPYNGPMRRK